MISRVEGAAIRPERKVNASNLQPRGVNDLLAFWPFRFLFAIRLPILYTPNLGYGLCPGPGKSDASDG